MGLLATLGLPSVAPLRPPGDAEVPPVAATDPLALESTVLAGPKADEAQKPRPVAEIQKSIAGAQGVLHDRRKLDQEWIERVTGKKVPVPNPVPEPDPRHPKKTRTPRAGTVGSRVGRIRESLEQIMGDGKQSDAIRQEAQRRLNGLNEAASELERLYRERARAQSAASGQTTKFDKGGKGGKKDPPTVGTTGTPHPKPGVGVKAPPMPQIATPPKFSKLRAAIGKLIEQGKLNAIPLGKQLAARAPRIVSGIDALFSVLDTLEMIENATSLLAHGTAMPKEQAAADQVWSQSQLAKTDAEAAIQDLSRLAWVIVIDSATRAKDEKGLYAIDEALATMSQALRGSVDTLQTSANDLFDRALPIDKASVEQLMRVYLPSFSTVQNANALAMHLSLSKLNNTLTAAAAYYREASEMLAWWAAVLSTLSAQANGAAWDIRVENRAAEIKAGRGISNR